jgi:hypothetical protein
VSGSAPVPKDFNEWMRRMERRVNDLGRRQTSPAAFDPFAQNVPRFMARLSGNSTITTATPTEIGFTSLYGAPYNQGSDTFMTHGLVGTQYRYNFTRPGLYYVKADLQWGNANNGGAKIHMVLNANGSPSETAWSTGGTDGSAFRTALVTIWPFAAGDYIRFVVQTPATTRGTLALNSAISGSNGHADSRLTIMPAGAYDFVA